MSQANSLNVHRASDSFRTQVAEAIEHELLRVHPKDRQEHLTRLSRHWSIHCYNSVSSTMDVAREATERKEETDAGFQGAIEQDASLTDKLAKFVRPHLYLAREQTAGRGRNNKTWQSNCDGGVYATFVLFPQTTPDRLAGLPLAVGIAIQRMASAYGVSTVLKWPNDVLIDLEGGMGFRKLAGILVETCSQANELESVLIGIGMNLETPTISAEIPAIGLTEVSAIKVDYFRVFAALFVNVVEICERFFDEGFGPFAAEWSERSRMTGRRVRFVQEGMEQTGTVIGIDHFGALRIRSMEGTGAEHRICSGEIRLV